MNILIIMLLLFSDYNQDNLETINSSIIDKKSDNYEKTLAGYKSNEFWGIWSMPIGDANSSICLGSRKGITYSVKNIEDYDLNTAWIPAKSEKGAYFEFVFHYPSNTAYAGAYQFYGICNLFNGYCKSIKLWKANSRVKTLKVYYNETPVCYVRLVDTWHFQSFNIAKFFKNKRFNKYLNAKFEIKEGDKLRFEIVDIYAGDKYKDVAISEFLCEGAGN